MDIDSEAFFDDWRTYRATLHNLTLIGEAASHISREWRAEHPEIPWRSIIALRNRIIHVYFGLDEDIIWNIVSVEVPPLLEQVRAILDRDQS